jgi:hypothetical protein
MDTRNKKNWLIKLTDITNQEWDDFISLVRDPQNHEDVNRTYGLECAVVSLFYCKTRDQCYTVNIWVSDKK